MNRRLFLTNSLAVLGGAQMLSAAPRRLFDRDGQAGDPDRTLVIIELTGGNDGLSTVVPYADDAYHRVRKSTRIPTSEVRKLNDYCGLHPQLPRLSRRYAAGGLAIFQGVGYPQANLSHFKSREIWHTANLRGRAGNDGWLGRLCDQTFDESSLPELSVHIGKEPPFSLYTKTHAPVAFKSPDTYRWLGDSSAQSALESAGERREGSTLDRIRAVMSDAQSSSKRILGAVRNYKTRVEYPGNKNGRTLRTAAALIDANLGCKIISVTIGGFDTHASQRADHGNTLGIVDTVLESFMLDLQRSEAGKNTVVLVTSEFGRRVRENGSGGTDHGKAGIAFALGAPVRGGLYGKYPSLTNLDNQDLRYNLDFRSLYASVIDWMGGDSKAVLEGEFKPVPFV